MLRVAVLASGNGTNFQALHDACRLGYAQAEIACVVTNRRSADVMARAEAAGVEGVVVPHKDRSRDQIDELILAELDRREIGLVCHAGYMRIRGTTYCKALAGRALNVHPSLLPAFPGANAIADAWEWGMKTSGVTVHYATEELDMGPIVAQLAIDVEAADTIESFEHKIHLAEYTLYPKVLKLFAEGLLSLEGRRVVIERDVEDPPWAGALPPGLR